MNATAKFWVPLTIVLSASLGDAFVNHVAESFDLISATNERSNE
jgi:hypothetical protein